jgi:hypothetical protein
MEIYEVTPVSYIYEYNIGWFPLKSMGIPLHYEKIRKEDIPPIIDKILKRISGWKRKLLPYAW